MQKNYYLQNLYIKIRNRLIKLIENDQWKVLFTRAESMYKFGYFVIKFFTYNGLIFKTTKE